MNDVHLVPAIFVSHANLQGNDQFVRLTFADDTLTQNKGSQVTPRAAVVMPIALAKALYDMLGEQLRSKGTASDRTN